MAVNASDPDTVRSRPSQKSRARSLQSPRTPTYGASSSSLDPSSSNNYLANSYSSTASTTLSTRTSLSSFRGSLPENPNLYDFSEIRVATNNFLAKRHSSSSSTPSWRCNLRGRDCIVFQRKFRRKIEMAQLREKLFVICRSHHGSIIKMIGASVSDDYIYLVYDFIQGANLADCLRSKHNPNFTVLSTWMSRMQIATDIAHGLDYIHNNTGLSTSFAHNCIKSSSIIVIEPSFNAKICHFGTAQLCGEAGGDNDAKTSQIQGVKGYMSPEFQTTGIATHKSDIYAFGVVILELVSGDEPLKYRFDKKKGDFIRTSLIETARAVIEFEGGERLRNWVDRRLRDSFPVEVAGKLTRVALDCVEADEDKRPEMGHVAGRISKLYLQSKMWADNLATPTGISVSLAPR